ncbi:MAG TPA: NAD(P)/FAD-dependent oxidoreductase [Vicinamibacterales bacterium]|nr:NAD(P)/FAD-dependent oxidoreductase [Vicinamibacterales bacterium]
MSDVVIIGGGHNGLVAAFYLAKAGLKPLVLERSEQVGGGAITTELHPGFRCPTLSHEVLLHEHIAREMDLHRHGVTFFEPPARVCAISPDGAPLVLWADEARTVEAMKTRSPRDADAYPRFREAIGRVASVLATTFSSPPPSIDDPSAGDIWRLLKAGRAFRALGRRDEFRLLRWLPMPVADLAHEWFESDLLRAAIAGPGVSGTMLGPRSAGSALVMLLREAHRRLAGHQNVRVRGGPGALTRALAAAAVNAGAEIRTGVHVERIVVTDERITGVLAGGREIHAETVISCADPKTTFLDLLDPVDLAPDFLMKIRNYRAAGTISKVNLALSALPSFRGVTDESMVSGRIHIGPDLDYLEKAFDHVKYGELSAAPWLDITIPSVLDPELAPAGAHVASVYVHYTPYSLRHTDWRSSKDALLARVLDTLETCAPGLRATVLAAGVITPADLQADYGFSGGHIFHGELALDQLYAMRPLLGFGKYETPIRGLHLCGGGTHPGGLMTGASGRLAARHVLRSRRQR